MKLTSRYKVIIYGTNYKLVSTYQFDLKATEHINKDEVSSRKKI
jgi:hypothetical protein